MREEITYEELPMQSVLPFFGLLSFNIELKQGTLLYSSIVQNANSEFLLNHFSDEHTIYHQMKVGLVNVYSCQNDNCSMCAISELQCLKCMKGYYPTSNENEQCSGN